jgi:hypothetical protein
MASNGSSTEVLTKGPTTPAVMLEDVKKIFEGFKEVLKSVFDGTSKYEGSEYALKYKTTTLLCESGFKGKTTDCMFYVRSTVEFQGKLLTDIWNVVQDGISGVRFKNRKQLILLNSQKLANGARRFLWAAETDRNTSFSVVANSDDFGVRVRVYDTTDFESADYLYKWIDFMNYSQGVPELKNFHARAVSAVQDPRNKGRYKHGAGHAPDINTGSCAKCGKQILGS